MLFYFNSTKKGRSLTNEEKTILNLKQEETNEDLSFSLGSSIELIDQILTDQINNGLGFVKTYNTEKNSFESLIIKLILEKHKLKRLFYLNWDIKHNLDVQNKFYDNSK